METSTTSTFTPACAACGVICKTQREGLKPKMGESDADRASAGYYWSHCSACDRSRGYSGQMMRTPLTLRIPTPGTAAYAKERESGFSPAQRVDIAYQAATESLVAPLSQAEMHRLAYRILVASGLDYLADAVALESVR